MHTIDTITDITEQPDEGTTPSSDATSPEPRRRPSRARWILAGLATASVLGLIGTIVVDGGDDAEVSALEAEIEQLRAERDSTLAELDELEANLALLRARVGATEAERDQLLDELDAAGADRAGLEAQIAELDRSLETMSTEITSMTIERDGAIGDAEELRLQLVAAKGATSRAIAERDALASRFPAAVDPALEIADVVGSYRVKWQEQFCSGLPTCGTVPAAPNARLRSTPEGFLRIELGSLVTSNLARVPGGFHAVAGSTTAIPQCDGVARSAKVTVTILPDASVVAANGAIDVRSWGGAVTIDAPAVGSCPAVLASYGVSLAPTA